VAYAKNGISVRLVVLELTIRGGEKGSGGIGCQPPSADRLPVCPSCQSARIFKDGLRIAKEGRIQRYVCRDCGYRFSESSKPLSLNLSDDDSSQETIDPIERVFFDPNNQCNLNEQVKVDSQFCGPLEEEYKKSTGSESIRRVCADEAKNLVATETIGNVVAGETSENRNILFEFAWYMKKEGYAETTGRTRCTLLKVLLRSGADLTNPDSVKDAIARQSQWCNKRKINAVDAYSARADRVKRLESTLRGARIEAELSRDMSKDIWEKFVINGSGSPVMALTRLPAGPLRDNPETRALLRRAIEESVAVAAAYGHTYPVGFVDGVLKMFEGYAPWAKSAILQDLEAGRRLELGALVGAVVRLGREKGVPTPLNDIIYAVLKPYENGAVVVQRP